jgi:fatty acid desaturase
MATGAIPDSGGLDMGTAGLAGRKTLDMAILKQLSHRSNALGALRAAAHLSVMAATAGLVYAAMHSSQPWLVWPAMVLHGFTLVTMFAPMHECVHRTAFANKWANEAWGWLAGLLSFYNFTYYRHYHTWHHRYTQDPEKDPELMDPKPTSFMGYAWEISGIGFWLRRPLTFLKLALTGGRSYPFVPEHGRVKVAISASLQLAIYVLAGVSIAMGYPYALWYFFLPAILAQPLLRALLIVEHTGCSYDEDGLTNTRTTLTNPFIRLLMWNMPFHTEHHLYPSIPFHQLPAAHREIKSRLAHLSPSYVAANREVIAACHPAPAADKTVAQETAAS